MRNIYIPGLKGTIIVPLVCADFDHAWTKFPSSPGDPEGYRDTIQLVDQKRTTRLIIQVVLVFPSYINDDGVLIPPYSQTVTGSFDSIVQADGTLTFSNTQIDLQGDNSTQGSNQFGLIDATAWLASKDPKALGQVVKIKLTVGSLDVVVVSKTRTDTDETSGTSDEFSAEYGVDVEVAKDIHTKGDKSWKNDPVHSRTGGRTTTLGSFAVQRTWTLTLQLPEPKAPAPAPGPFGLPEPYKFYFDTGKSNADHYRSRLNGMIDQIKGLQSYLNDIDKAYGFENLQSVTVTGYASGLGDTRGNIGLSLNRGKYVTQLFTTLYVDSGLIPPSKLPPVIPKGARVDASSKDNKDEDRRAELLVKIKGGTKRKTP